MVPFWERLGAVCSLSLISKLAPSLEKLPCETENNLLGIQRSIRQPIRLFVLAAADVPKEHIHPAPLQEQHQRVKLAEVARIRHCAAHCVAEAVAPPLAYPVRHGADEVRRVSLDDELAHRPRGEVPVAGNVERRLERRDAAFELGLLAGGVQRRQHAAPVVRRVGRDVDADGGRGAGGAVVAAGAVGSDNDAVGVRRAVAAARVVPAVVGHFDGVPAVFVVVVVVVVAVVEGAGFEDAVVVARLAEAVGVRVPVIPAHVQWFTPRNWLGADAIERVRVEWSLELLTTEAAAN